jgi:hypothetical protein
MMATMIETVVLTKLQRLPDSQKKEVLDFVEFLESRSATPAAVQSGDETAVSEALYINPERQAMLQEQAAFQAMLPDLLTRYEDQYVAVYQGQVIDHDADQVALIERLDQSHPDTIVLVKQVTTEPERVLRMRSPRLINNGVR